MLEGLHCGIDVSKKMADDQAALEAAQRKADYESMAAAQRAHLELKSQLSCRVRRTLLNRQLPLRRAP